MRLALIGRCRERGLGTLTWEIARHLNPAKVLVVKRDHVDFRDDERFPGARWCDLDEAGRLPDADIDWLLTDVDALITAETPYDYRVFEAARRRGVRTALMGMLEYLAYRRDASLPRPDLFLAPSPWRLDEWPGPCEYLPVPVAADRFTIREVSKVRTIVHCAGAFAKGDRNGTQSLLQALQYIRSTVRVVVVAQGFVRRPHHRGRVTLEIRPPTENYWEVFAGADAAVLPRRYGGLSLPLQEATAQGLPILGLTREHDAGYHHAAVVPCTERPMRLPCGPVDRAEVEPTELARAIDRLVEDDVTAQQMAECSRAVAAEMTWGALQSRWEATLERLAA